MKNKIAISAITSALLLSANPTFAYDTGDGFVGAQYAMATYSESGVPDFDVSALVIRGGYFFNKYFSLEGRLGFGIGDDTQNVFGIDINLELDNMYGIYGVGHIPLNQTVDLYGVIGFTNAEASAEAVGIPGATASGDESDLSFGIGADFLVSKNISLNLEYMAYLSKDVFDLSALGFGINYNF